MKTFLLVAMIVEGLVGIACIGSPQAAFVTGVVLPVDGRSGQSAMMRAATEGFFAYYLVSSLVIIPAQLAGVMNATGWIVVALHLGLAGWARYAAAKGA